MALQGIDGCDLFSVAADVTRRYPSNVDPTTIVPATTGGRFGGGAIRGNSTNGKLRLPVSGSPTTLYFAAAIKLQATMGYTHNFISFVNSAAVAICGMRILSGNTGEAVRGLSTQLGVTSDVIAYTTGYHWLEFKATIHASTGTIDVRVDGTSVLSLTGQNTEGATGGVRWIEISLGDSGGGFYIDDFIWYDTTGSGITDFTGDRRIETLRPNGDGGTIQFGRSGGSFNYEMVDDSPQADDDATYNYTATSGNKDRLDVENLSGFTVGSIDAVQSVIVRKKGGAESMQSACGVYSGTTESVGNKAVGNAYEFHQEVFELNPDDSLAWEEADVNAVQLQYGKV